MGFKIFIDTDVIIDFLIDRQPHAEASSKILNLSDKGIIQLYTSALCINNIHYVIKKVVGEKKARSIIHELLALISVIEVDETDLKNALDSSFSDFEDAIQYSTAQKIKGLKAILTRNTKDYKKSKIAIFTPETLIKTIEIDL
ncbi:MAG: PIN domain-containing protein [Fulvivirga sp.]|uniref:type II toxin-antitoxin system VapC family toxin n=1 Tax=Fulvivirga sp. TaxID=1931237 RepID=UPI0032EF06C2